MFWACGERLSLLRASQVIILDIHLNPSLTWQPIDHAFTPGQKRKLFIAADSPEEEHHGTCFQKVFQLNEYRGYQDFEVEHVNVLYRRQVLP
ncbi:hypothetical protein RchiOBHm_Chr2g0120051 [Rosa chinensis]|uniref:Uncharacterized protein n=1 Tax=Rosa chinensis TaxID=74649 RepID=A0A2P6RS57_ROSCH|nr:hypothetical protein RchiOBHm_Chr2g0120051 [Rosa chinensis]